MRVWTPGRHVSQGGGLIARIKFSFPMSRNDFRVFQAIRRETLRVRSVTFSTSANRISSWRGGDSAPRTTLQLRTGSGECRVMSGMLINLIIQIISGAVGGNVAGGAAKNIDLG
ncbi:MAG: hypothetical protein ACREDY_19495, partial [Bradyrhizobium sp.]